MLGGVGLVDRENGGPISSCWIDDLSSPHHDSNINLNIFKWYQAKIRPAPVVENWLKDLIINFIQCTMFCFSSYPLFKLSQEPIDTFLHPFCTLFQPPCLLTRSRCRGFAAAMAVHLRLCWPVDLTVNAVIVAMRVVMMVMLPRARLIVLIVRIAAYWRLWLRPRSEIVGILRL